MADLKPFGIFYRHNGIEWMTGFHAEDIEDAKRKLRSMATNGVVNPITPLPVPGIVPLWLIAPFLSLTCIALNAWSGVKKWLRS